MTIHYHDDKETLPDGLLFRRRCQPDGVVSADSLAELMEFDGRETGDDAGYCVQILKQIGEGGDAYCDLVALARR